MQLWEDRGFRIFCNLYFLIYIGASIYGVTWISDEFDRERTLFYACFAIPLVIIFYAVYIMIPQLRRQYPKSFYSAVIIIFLSFSWGNILLLNAVSGKKPEILNVTIADDAYYFDYKRGGFGILYRFRW